MSDAAAIPATDAAPELNPALALGALTEEFRRKGRIHIPNVLTAESARRLFLALKDETPWNLSVNKGNDTLDFPKLSAEERQKIATSAWERAQTQFQFLYDTHRMSHDGEPYPNPNHYLARVIAYLNTPHFLTVIRQITGIEEIVRTDARACLYRPGDFLTIHDDKYGGRHRLAAYVLSMTPGWRPDWGGVLNFYDARGHIEEGFVPAFNALNLFRVPAWHSVGQVAIFGGLRYSITGWFHAAKKLDDPAR